MGWNLFGRLMPPAVDTAEEKERRYSGDSGNESQEEAGVNNSDTESSAVTTLEFQLTQSLLSRVKADENDKGVKSGEVTDKDLHRMNFVINGQEIGPDFPNKLYSVVSKSDEGKKNYRPSAKSVFTKIFKYAKAEVPDDSILEELVTNCNQAGYHGSLVFQLLPIFSEHNLKLSANERISIICNSQDSLNIQCCANIPVMELDKKREMCRLDAILEFTLKSQNGKVEYKDGKITLTIPEQLKDYKVGRKSLLGDIKSYFNASQNTKRYVIAASALAILGIISGVAVAVYLEMSAVGIAVGACCLVAAAVIYCCRPKNALEDNEVKKVDVTRKSTSCCS